MRAQSWLLMAVSRKLRTGTCACTQMRKRNRTDIASDIDCNDKTCARDVCMDDTECDEVHQKGGCCCQSTHSECDPESPCIHFRHHSTQISVC